jgi:large subunit ribosomal protein L19
LNLADSSPEYPFSRNIHVPPPSTTPIPAHALSPRNGSSVVTHINTQLREVYDPQRLLKTLFSRRHPFRARPGSVISVISYTTPARTTTSTFSGVLLSIRRRGVDTSFRLRNMVGKTGVESDFKVCSPMIKDIVIVKSADGRSGMRNLGRAQVNYLRERPQVMAQIASALKTRAGIKSSR